MPPVSDFIAKHATGCIVDPFSRNSTVADLRNDIDPATNAKFHMDAVAFLEKLIRDGVQCDTLLVDPPYSPRQMQEHYRPGNGNLGCSTAFLMGQIRKLAPQLVLKGGRALTFGWNSNGMGKPFELIDVLLIAHGASHNDTICTAEWLPLP